MAQIAEGAGVAVGTLYNHFKDRESLLEALLNQRRGELLQRLDDAHVRLAKEPFKKQLDGFLRTLLDHFEAHRALLRIVFLSEHGAWNTSSDLPRALYQRIEELLKLGRREKVLKADPCHSHAVVLLGSVRAMLVREKYGAPPIDSDAAVVVLAELFLDGAGR
jgi:AcrR family transcriptional regulator